MRSMNTCANIPNIGLSLRTKIHDGCRPARLRYYEATYDASMLVRVRFLSAFRDTAVGWGVRNALSNSARVICLSRS